MILNDTPYMYNSSYDVITNLQNIGDLNNKLFATFIDPRGLDDLIYNITSHYDIMYNKIFVLEILGKSEYVITYNVDQGNVDNIPENTILVHRKKESNTLYTINALNGLIKTLNGGVVDPRYRIEWQHYRNCILLTQNNELNQLNTKIHKIIDL